MISTSNKPFAEVVKSSLHHFTAQSWHWDTFATYGSLVVVEQGLSQYVGLVSEVQTGSMDPTRYPFPFQKSETELKKEQPQIFEFLRTTFTCLLIGYVHKGNIHYAAIPQPPKMHAFVQPIMDEARDRFLSDSSYLHRIFSVSNLVPNLDDLLLALLAEQKRHKPLSSQSMQSFMQNYWLLTGNDYRRLKLFVQQMPSI